jgi:hypothetical protein
MGRKPATKIIRRADINVAIAELKKVNVPQAAAVALRSQRSFGRHPSPCRSWVACHPKPDRAKGGGAGGIRTLDRALQPYNGLANRRLQPLGHSSVEADMPDAGASRKRPIPGCRNPSHIAPYNVSWRATEPLGRTLPMATATSQPPGSVMCASKATRIRQRGRQDCSRAPVRATSIVTRGFNFGFADEHFEPET